MGSEVISAYSKQGSSAEAARELIEQLGDIDASAILFYCFHEHDGALLSRTLKDRYPGAQVIGCTTAGEFTDRHYGAEAVAAIAISKANAPRAAATMVRYEDGVEVGVKAAAADLSRQMTTDVRELDSARHVGVVLNTALHGREEAVNEELGHAAPLISFVGGSAGDNFRLERTEVFHDGEVSHDASVLLLLELAVPYTVIKTSSFEPTERTVEITRIEGRTVYELDGKPAVPAYAEAIGVPVEALDHAVFMANPLGLMIDGKPWVRSPIRPMPDGGLMFGCAMLEGSTMYVLKSTNLLNDTKDALEEGARRLGGSPSGGLLFNCAHRRIEIEMKQIEDPFSKLLSRYPVAGFQCYGESWLGHVNQTLVGILLG